jgi:hypothetical protein
MVNITKTEKEIEEAKAKKEEEELKVQIEVYEGQSYEARQAYEKAQEKYTATRRKLPKDIPTDKDYKEQDLQAQYIQARVISPTQEKQVKEYRAEIEKQQKASKSVQVLNKELPQLYSSAVQEVESVKTGVEKAKQKVTDKYDPIIQTKTKAVETEKARRAKQFADVQTAYKEALSNNPYTQEKGSVRRRELEHGRHFNVTRFNYKWRQQSQNYIKQAKQAKIEAEKKIRYEHLTLEGRSLKHVAPNAGFNWDEYNRQEMWRLDARELNPSYHGGNLILAVARENYLRGMYDFQTYSQIAGGGARAVKAEKEAQAERARAKSKAQLAGAVAKDRAHWASVASNPYTSNPNYKTPNFTVGSGTKDDPFRTDYNKGKTAIGETTTPPKEMVAYYLRSYQDQSTKYNKAKTGLENTNYSQADLQQINKQRETELANRRQQQYVAELRAGNIGQADALMNPQTTQSYTGTSTVNLKTFLKERGYDLSKPEAIPDSVLTKPVKYTEARKQASDSEMFNTPMGDLRFKEPYYAGFGVQGGKIDFRYKYPEASAETQMLRRQAKERIAKFDPKPMDSLVKDSSYVGETGTITLKKNEVLTKKQSDKWGFDPIANQVNKDMQTTWTVTVKQKGAEYTADFKTREEAVAFKKSQEPKVFSGTDNVWWNKFMYASAVDSGEVISPKKTPTLTDDVRYYSSVVWRPLINLGASAVNLTQPKDKQIPIYQTGAERLIGGTIDDVVEGQPLKGTGVTGTWKYIEQDPLRAVLELPAEAVMWVGGGKAISLGTQAVRRGVKVITPTIQSVERSATQTGYNIVQSTKVPSLLKTPVEATMVTGKAIETGIKKSQRGIEKTQQKLLQYNPLTFYQYRQVEKIGSSIYKKDTERRIEKIGSTYVISAGTESSIQSVPAITVKFGKSGKTTYYTDSPSLGVSGSEGIIFKGNLPKGIAESTKTGKYLYEVPVKDDIIKLKDPMKLKLNEGRTNTVKEYITPIQSFTKQDVGQQVGFKITEKTGTARKAQDPPFYREYTKETIIETDVLRTTPKKVRYDMDGKIIKDTPVDKKPNTILKDLTDESNITGKTGTGKKSDIIESTPSKEGTQTKLKPKTKKERASLLEELARGEAKASVKTSPYRSAIVGTATKASAVVGTKALASTRVDTGVKIQQDISTGLLQETALKTQQELKTPQRLKQTTRMKLDTGLKLDTGSKLMTQQKTALSFSSPIKTQSRTQRPKALPFVLPKVEETETRGKRKRGKKAGFIGNVRLDSIVGMYKRQEITYGAKKVRKLERLDMRLTTNTPNRLSTPSSSLLKTKRKGKSKTETILGRSVTKTKDEFAGFKTKKQTKRSKKSKTTKVRLL